LTTFFEDTYHLWCIRKYTQLCAIVLFFFYDTIFTTNWCATWGLKLDSKDVQGRAGMKIKGNMVQSLPMETPNISLFFPLPLVFMPFHALPSHASLGN